MTCSCCPGTDIAVARVGYLDRFHVCYGSKIRSYDKLSGGAVAANFAFSSNSQNIKEIDPERNVYYFTASNTLIEIRKYTWDATQLWAWTDTATGGADGFETTAVSTPASVKIEIDGDRNVYVAYAYYTRSGSFTYRIDAVVVKIDSDGNTVWTKTKQGPAYGFQFNDRLGYAPRDVTVLRNGDVHVTGKAVYFDGSTGDEGTGRFEWHLDKNGTTLWTDIEDVIDRTGVGTGTNGDGQFLSWGENVVSDRDDNVHIVYSNSADDSLTLVGYSDTGTTLYEYSTSTIAELVKIETRDDYLFADSTSFGLRRYSTTTNWWDTTDWTYANGGGYDWNLDNQNRVFMAQAFGLQARLRGVDSDGTELFNVTNTFDGPGNPLFLWPGRSFL